MSTRTEEERTAEAAEVDDASVEPDEVESEVDEPGSRRPWWRRVWVLALAVLLVAAGGGYAWYRSTVLPDNVAFRLGDQDVTVDQLDRKTDTLRALYGVQAPTDPAKLDGFRKDVAKSTAVGMILDKAAADRDIVIADKTAQDTLARFIGQQYGNGNDAHDKFVQALGTVGTTEKAVLDEIKRQLAVNQLFEKVSAGTAVSDADVQKAFPQRKDALGTPERRDLRNIVVSSKAEADQVVTALKNGAGFETVAAQRSLDASTKNNGGSLGAVAANQLDKPYADAAFAAPVNAVFGPVQTQYGWNVGKVVQVMAPVPAVFDQVKDKLKQQLQTEGQLAKWRAWLASAIKDASVEYADSYRPADPDGPPPGQPGAPAIGAK
ncbi:peptidylprolyl isomerase [Amycolatopsis circi]|uniref:peptidylprolyl isomerase n=1 Tax=Amycolatopsis circi TaxID=871959 RepID=UPI000E23C160|nr:peptidylprolyl isomerase [Amycolatopsis circi]